MTINDTETGDTKRLIIVDPASRDKCRKDRTGRLGRYIEPDFTKIVDGVQRTAGRRVGLRQRQHWQVESKSKQPSSQLSLAHAEMMTLVLQTGL